MHPLDTLACLSGKVASTRGSPLGPFIGRPLARQVGANYVRNEHPGFGPLSGRYCAQRVRPTAQPDKLLDGEDNNMTSSSLALELPWNIRSARAQDTVSVAARSRRPNHFFN